MARRCRLIPLTALLTLFPVTRVSPCRADLIIHGLLVTHSGTVVDTLVSTLQLKGSHLRRSLEGKGALALFFGRRLELVNRASGETTTLDLDALTYERSAAGVTCCHPLLLVDLRWLGRTQGGVKGELAVPDTSAMILGTSAHPVDFRFPARQAGGSTIRIWITRELDSLFGKDGVRALYCGAVAAPSMAAPADLLARQFGLSREAADTLRRVADGYPVRIESFVGQGSERIELSRFETLSVEHTALADSIFSIPKTFRPAPAQDE